MDNNHDTPLGFWGSEAQEVLSKSFPIHKACLDGDVATLMRLCAVASPAEMVAEDQFYSWTPIHWAAYFGKNQCILGLLQSGVNVNLETSKFKQTPTHIAAFGGHPDTLVGLLKAGADYHARDYMGEIPLHKAARVGNVECVKQLINNGTHANICNNEGVTAGAIARNLNFIEVAHLLEIACSQLPNPHQQMQTTNGFHLTNGTSGSHVTHANGHSNGVNGHLNGVKVHSNGVNGFMNGSTNRKRTCDDVSMPTIKRARMAGNHQGYDGSSSISSKTDLRGLCGKPPGIMECSFQDSCIQPFPSIPDHNVVDPLPDTSTKKMLPVYTNDANVPGSNPRLGNGIDKKKIQLNGFHHEVEEDPMDCHGNTDTVPIHSGITDAFDDVTRAPSPGMEMKLHKEDDLQLWGYYHGYGDTAECIPEEEEPITPSHSNGLILRGTQSRGWR